MGKKVFEIAKDIGLDHRQVMKRCDDLGIGVKTYMSDLSDADAATVKSSFEADRNPKAMEEKAGSPGVLRRKRPEPAPAPAAPKPAVQQKPPVPQAPQARPGVMTRPPVPRAETPVVLRPAQEPAPLPVRAAESDSTTPAPRAQAPVETPVERTPPVSVAQSAAEPPVERAPVVTPRPDLPVEPAAETQAGVSRPTPTPPAAEPAPEVRRPPAAVATQSLPGGQPAPPAQPPRPIPPGTPGGAKVLGTVPLDLLRSRTARPPARRPGPGGPGGPPGSGPQRPLGVGPGAPPGGPRRPAGTGRPLPLDVNQVVPLPVDRGDGTRRRRPGSEAPPATAEAREAEKARAAKAVAGKKRQVVSREDLYSGAGRAGRGRKRKVPTKRTSKTALTTPAAHKRIIRIDGTVSVGELGKALGVKASELLQKLISMGMMVTINAQLDPDTATLLATEYGYEISDVGFDEDVFLETPDEEKTNADPDAVLRAPVITVMGHVDHGKTSLMDFIRKARVAAGEAGGITQHIGAYKVHTAHGDVVFLDTPGHAAFTAMRARGAQVTDLVVLVVAADDGVMPQTIEAISHARAANVPIIVAINKIDKPGIDPERIKQELTKYSLVAEEWGGETMMVPVSALKGTGVQELLDALALQAEILELKANPKKAAFGRVVEARVDKGRGPVSTVLVQDGTLKVGDFMVAGAQCGRLRAMVDDKGNRLKEAGPSTPVEVLGLDGIPAAGEAFHIVTNEKDAKRIVEARADKFRDKELAASASATAAGGDVFARLNLANKETLLVILKTDVQGSLEAVRSTLEALTTSEVALRILHAGVGPITEGDITLAQASEAVCIGFNVGPDNNAKKLADQTGVKIRKFEVIYEVADEVKLMMGGLLPPEIVETQLGRAEVRAAFQVARMGSVAGCFVLDGKIQRNVRGRIFRGNQLVHEGKINGLKRFKEDVREVSTGFECGISVDGYNDIQTGDILEAVEVKEVARKLA